MAGFNSGMKKFMKTPFVWEGENYLVKMKTDNMFLSSSYMANIFEFSTKSDPFIMYPSSLSNKGSAGKEYIPIPQSLIKRIR